MFNRIFLFPQRCPSRSNSDWKLPGQSFWPGSETWVKTAQGKSREVWRNEVPAQGRKGTVTEIRLGAGGLRHFSIWRYKPKYILLKKQLLCQGLSAAGWQNCLFFYQGYIYRETRDIKESDVFEYCVWQHSTWIRSLGKRASTMNLQAQCCMEPTELCRALMNNKPETRKVRKPIGWSSLLWPTT